MSLKVIGIDPGINGAIVCLSDDGIIIHRIPIVRDGKNRVFAPGLVSRILENHAPDLIVLEKVHSMPGQGVSSTFKFGMVYGALLESAAQYNYILVTPQSWKRQFSLIGQSKDAARLKAIELFPEMREALKLKKDVDKADALLLALYGRINESINR